MGVKAKGLVDPYFRSWSQKLGCLLWAPHILLLREKF